MNDTIIDTINNVIDTIVQTTNNQIVETTLESWNCFASFWGYWLPAILIIGTAIFFRRFLFTNSSISYSTSFDERDKTKDIRIRNIYVVLAIILALCPYANWALIVITLIAFMGSGGDFPFYLNVDKFYSDKLMNFLFNGEMEKTTHKKEKFKDL